MSQQHISNFLQKLRAEDGLSKNTTLSYGKDLELFLKFTKGSSLLKVDTDLLKDYIYELHNEGFKPATISRKISCLKNFYKFLVAENLIKESPASQLKSPKGEAKLPKFLSEEEMLKLLNTTNSDKSEFGVKLSAMLEILYAAGLRVSELVSLPMSAIQIEGNTLRNYLIVKGKGSKERIAPLNKAAISRLLDYLKLRQELGFGSSKWLFVGTYRASKTKEKIARKKLKIKDSHLTRQRFHQMLKELAAKAGVDPKKVHPHVIRHSFATHLLNSGVDLRILQELLGHSDIATTEIYTHILDSKLQDLVFKHHPLSKA
jgi:integrase/recombinase XerD